MSQSRLFELVYYLLEHGMTPARVLSERFEVSVRTIYRDVDALSAAGVPIYAEPGRGGGVALLDHYTLDRAIFSDTEQAALLAALRSLAGNPGLGVDEALEKLSGLFRRAQPDWLEVDLSRWGGSKGNRDAFDALREAILGHKVITFTYAGSYGGPAARQALPARLVFKGQAWYLQAFCLDRQNYRTFKLSRIRDLAVTGRTFITPLAPPPIDHSDNPVWPTVKLKLRLSPALAFRAYDEFEPEQVTALPDGSLRVEAEFPEDNWVYGYLLSFGPMMEILEPERVRRTVAELARQIIFRCENPDIGCQGLGAILGSSYIKEALTMNIETTPFCQSCGMPLTDPTLRGTEADGAPSKHYCKYCYDKGKFAGDMTMEEMIDFCAPMMAKANPGMTEEDAKEQMRNFYPQLLRWREKK